MGWSTPLERFYEKIQPGESGCWQWVGGRKAAGYGQFMVDGRKVIAHRWAYQYFVGAIPEDLEIDHLCRNASCVNPAHLEPVTKQENHARRSAFKTHCVNGHEYTPESTYEWTDRQGSRSRRCRICNTHAAMRRYRRLQAAA